MFGSFDRRPPTGLCLYRRVLTNIDGKGRVGQPKAHKTARAPIEYVHVRSRAPGLLPPVGRYRGSRVIELSKLGSMTVDAREPRESVPAGRRGAFTLRTYAIGHVCT